MAEPLEGILLDGKTDETPGGKLSRLADEVCAVAAEHDFDQAIAARSVDPHVAAFVIAARQLRTKRLRPPRRPP